MQEAILLFFQRISNPALDFIAQAVTMAGELTVSIVLICTILWCLDKYKALALCTSLLTAQAINGTIKAIVRYPRPWLVIPALDSTRIETATGYSFPSGHTTTGASMYGSLAKAFKKRWLSIICAVLILLVGVSRLYLRVHWPMDVAGGLIIGLSVSLLLYDKFYEILSRGEKAVKFMFVYFIVGLCSALVLAVGLDFMGFDSIAFTDLMKNMAFIGGGYLGAILEARYVGYDASKGSLLKKLLRLVVGLILVVLVKSSSRILPDLALMDTLRYFAIAFVAIFLWPLIGLKIKLFEKAD